MSKTMVSALAAAGSLLAGAAFAEGTTSKDAAKPATASKHAKQAQSTDVVSMAPVPDTKENRAKYGKPLSRMGRETATRGN